MINPWLNITLNDTVADCDKEFINALNPKIQRKLELRTLPEPFHGNPEANVYILNGNPLANEDDLRYIGNTVYEAEVQDELAHRNTNFLWLRGMETITDSYGNSYPGYKWWKARTKALLTDNIEGKIFCIESFPYHTLHANDFKTIKGLPSNEYMDSFIRQAIKADKLIIVMRCKNYWLERIPALKTYQNIIYLNSPQCVYLTPKNMSAANWRKLMNAL